LRETIRLAKQFSKSPEDTNFWKLQYKIKWELELYNPQLMKPLEEKLIWAFTSLRYKKPEEETELMLIQLDGMASRCFLHPNFDISHTIKFLLNKYGV